MRPQMTPAAVAKGDLENFIAAATPGGIEAQEAAGQAAFVKKGSLPIDASTEPMRSAFLRMGFEFGRALDDLFVEVTMPPGWSKRATDHSMWSDLLDDKGRKRGGLFYKAAFYDRKAHTHLNCRYRIGPKYPDNREGLVRFLVEDHDGTVLFDAGELSYTDWAGHDAANKKCGDWLNEHFPEWKDPAAYWD